MSERQKVATYKKVEFGTSNVVQWVQVAMNLIGVFLTVLWFFNALDKRLTVMETKMEGALKNEAQFETRDVATMQYQILQHQIDEMKSDGVRR